MRAMRTAAPAGTTRIRVTRLVQITVLSAFALVLTTATSFAQGADRGGFTFLVDAGVGVQQDEFLEETAIGLGGLNAGVGAFVNPNLAVMFRIVGTNASYDFGSADYRQVSGVAGGVAQFWPSDRFNVEAGGGIGFWSGDDTNERAGGLILGAGFTVFNRGKHNVQVGVQYAPAFTDPGTVHNFSFTVGYQLF